MTNQNSETFHKPESVNDQIEIDHDLKQNRWDTLLERMKLTVDGIGGEIDEGIMETVVAFNALDFSTSASCEGHLDHGIASPWVDIEAAELDEETLNLIEEKYNTADLIHQKLNSPAGDEVSETEIKQMEELWNEAYVLRTEVARPIILERKRLTILLSEFYTGRQVPFDTLLTIERLGYEIRISCQGAEIQDVEENEEVRKQKLSEFQAEMRAFTEFLKKKFFS